MASGVGVNDEVVEVFQEMKMNHKYKYLVFKLADTLSEIVVDSKGDKDASYDEFVEKMPEDDCRYALVDIDYEKEGAKRSKLTFFVWAPDNAKIKKKMLYASSKDALRKKLVGIATEIQATDAAELAFDDVLEKVSARDR